MLNGERYAAYHMQDIVLSAYQKYYQPRVNDLDITCMK